MTYLDADFLVHYLVVQDKEKNRIAVKNFGNLVQRNQVFISMLALQEVSFVLGKLQMPNYLIEDKLAEIEPLVKHNFTKTEFSRAKELASKVGFENINDCLHTAIAESHCKELYTFNKNGFERIKPLTNVEIRLF